MIGQGLHRFSGQFLIVVFLFVEVVLVGELVANLEGGSCEGWPPIVAASYFLKQARVVGLLSQFRAADLWQDRLHNDFFAMRRLRPGAIFGSRATFAHGFASG